MKAALALGSPGPRPKQCEWDPVFANTEASSSTSGNAVETDQVAVQSNASASSALSPTSKVTNASVSTVSGTAVLEATASGSSTLDADTTSTTTSLLPNWVGTVDPSDNACYRQTYISRTCSTGYAYDKIATCWAQCPMNYPLNTASAAVQQGVKCGQKLFTVVKNIVNYAEKLQTQFPNGTEEQIISLLNNSDIVIKDLPTAVSVCLGLDVPTDYLNLASEVVGVVKKVLTQAVEKGSSLLSVDTFMSFTSAVGAGTSVEALDEDDTSTLEKLISEGETCGTELQSIITKVTQAVADIKSADATSPASAIRLALSDTALFLTEIPTVTNNCIRNITSTSDAYTVRDKIRKALSVITDNLIDSSDDGKGNALSKAEYILKVADMGLDVIAMFDPTGIAKPLEEFIQPVCGPTSFIGEIDDGSLTDALALVADGNAFAGSYGTWTHTGDGAVNIVFENTDTKDVTVEIHSAGETIDSVKVKRGKTVPWNSTVSVLQDKTMYFDRWRPGLLGLPGSGGGSLVMWVPRSSEGGHIDLVAKINVS
ncbi:hypothetical protein PF003_g15004 [Phytophthora fragariae]|nr:hypothetical protein PF003_g15004 [Phytophthora fragariae]